MTPAKVVDLMAALKSALGDTNVTPEYVVWSFEHSAWWGPNHAGYTRHLEQAGRYTAAEAGEIVTRSIMGEEVALHERTAELNGPPTVDSLWPQERETW